MKILILNPNIDASHDIFHSLRTRGDAILLASNAVEAWQMLLLHGKTVDIAVVHREGINDEGEEGLEFVNRFKTDPKHSDLPYILTTKFWSEDECAAHQNESVGANAYVKSPFQPIALEQTIDAVLGIDRKKSPPPPPVQDPQNDVAEISLDMGSPRVSPPPIAPQANQPPPAPSDSLQVSLQSEPPKISERLKDELSMSKVEEPLVPDEQMQEKLSYLFGEVQKVRGEIRPLGDAIVPGGMKDSPDKQTLKKYLSLREQDVAYLSKELRAAHRLIAELTADLKTRKSQKNEQEHLQRELENQLFEVQKTYEVERASMDKQLAEVDFELKRKSDKARILEAKVKDAENDIDKIKERVRIDIRKIRVREKELENKLEVMKKDSEILIQNRENRIIELKRRLDLLEFNLDLLQDQHAREKDRSKELEKRLNKASQAMRVAGGFLESEGDVPSEETNPEIKSKAS